jgi:hypothetical protein
MPDTTSVERPADQCTICSSLAEHESAVQKVSRPDHDSYLPAASHDLIIVKSLNSLAVASYNFGAARSVVPIIATKPTTHSWSMEAKTRSI